MFDFREGYFAIAGPRRVNKQNTFSRLIASHAVSLLLRPERIFVGLARPYPSLLLFPVAPLHEAYLTCCATYGYFMILEIQLFYAVLPSNLGHSLKSLLSDDVFHHCVINIGLLFGQVLLETAF